MKDLKLEFTERWAIESRWSYDAPNDSDGELWNDRDSKVIALEMLEKGIYFWEHRGWEDALLYEISPTIASKEDSQRLSARLLLNAPLGYAELNPRIVAWAKGDFSEHDRFQSLVNKTLPEWLERKNVISQKESTGTLNVSFENYLTQKPAEKTGH